MGLPAHSPILLTGASGFVGSHARELLDCHALEAEGKEIDLRDYDRVLAGVRAIRPDYAIHLAAQSFVPESFTDPKGTYDINFQGTLNLLGALRASGFRGRMVYAGSGDVYGAVPADELPISEDRPLKPRSPYAVSKVAAEALCYQWSQTESFEIVLARPFNHVGARQAKRFVVQEIASQIAEIGLGRREPVLKVGNTGITRDFTDVRDVVRAYGLLLERGRSGETYNICSGVERSIEEIIKSLLRLGGVHARVESDPARFRPGEQDRVRGSHRKLTRDTGWTPEIEWDKTLVDILTYWKEQLIG